MISERNNAINLEWPPFLEVKSNSHVRSWRRILDIAERSQACRHAWPEPAEGKVGEKGKEVVGDKEEEGWRRQEGEIYREQQQGFVYLTPSGSGHLEAVVLTSMCHLTSWNPVNSDLNPNSRKEKNHDNVSSTVIPNSP